MDYRERQKLLYDMLYKDGLTSTQGEGLGRLNNEYALKDIYLRSGNSFWSRMVAFCNLSLMSKSKFAIAGQNSIMTNSAN